MKAFLWQYIEECSGRYHSGGGVLIEAETLERAREIAFYKDDEWSDESILKPMIGIDAEPDAIFESQNAEEKVWVFQDGGCC